MSNYNTNLEVLQDLKKNGKERPWRAKKMRSLIVAESFKRLGESARSGRIEQCGTFLEFTKEIETGVKHLTGANFCRERLCPMCQWRRSLKVFYELSNAMDVVEKTNKNLVPLFLTLTVKSCSADDVSLSLLLDSIFSGWKRLLDNRKMKKTIIGWFRALEITYNKTNDEFHPHMHAIILVDKSYFKKDYLRTENWAQLWREEMRVDYTPICDIRRVRNIKSKRKSIAEVAKYTVKDVEIATGDKILTDKLICVLSKALKGRRLYAFGGLLRKIKLSESDLVNVGGTVRNDVTTVVEKYRWNFGIMNFERIRTGAGADIAAVIEAGGG